MSDLAGLKIINLCVACRDVDKGPPEIDYSESQLESCRVNQRFFNEQAAL
jgi:hypothetical protein